MAASRREWKSMTVALEGAAEVLTPRINDLGECAFPMTMDTFAGFLDILLSLILG